MSDRTRTVLIVQHQTDQAELWRAIFESQDCITVIAPPQADMVDLVTQIKPHLLIVDMTSGLFNPFALCRDCRSRFPDLLLILTHHVGCSIEAAAKRWALLQGATDMLPGLASAQEVIETAEQVFTVTGWGSSIDGSALETHLERIGFLLRPAQEPLAELPPSPEEDLPTLPAKPDLTNGNGNGNENRSQRSDPNPTSLKLQVMYRGRPLHKP